MHLADIGTDEWWRDCCDRGIVALAAQTYRTGATFQAFDLIDIGVPEPDSPNRWGPRLLAAARAGIVEPVGYGPSKRPTVAKSAARIWRGTALAVRVMDGGAAA
ncbi:hypothetical protein FL583_15615 [Cryptosporangium phraense]|uniref:Uncharacterized protein n=2 Tax=Cryptosporangium phraense TaxID=2593070 RepID=A0A545ASQ1_9ACTN|nr:hypothetical protein FL583_15615 [Cryptosporangium phraense]